MAGLHASVVERDCISWQLVQRAPSPRSRNRGSLAGTISTSTDGCDGNRDHEAASPDAHRWFPSNAAFEVRTRMADARYAFARIVRAGLKPPFVTCTLASMT